MQKKRVNLADAYPTYFATAELSENFAELTDVEIGRLDKIEAALTAKAEIPAQEVPATEEVPAVQAAAPVVEVPAVEENPQTVALMARLESLEKQLNQKPAAAATVVADSVQGEGQGKDKATSYACDIDAELAQFYK